MLHALLRQYAEEKLAEMPELADQAHDRQARYFARFLESSMRRMLGPEQGRAFDAVAVEFDDIHQAWEWWGRRGEFGRLVDQMLLPLYLYATARFVGTDVAPLLDLAIELLVGSEDGRRQTIDHRPQTTSNSQGMAAENPETNLPPSPLPITDSAIHHASLLIARMGIYANYYTQEFDLGDIHTAWQITAALGSDAPRRLGIWYAVLNLVHGWRFGRPPAQANLRALVAEPDSIDEITRAFARQALARLLTYEFAPEAELLEARRHADDALVVFERWGNRDACAAAYSDQADISILLGRFDEALAYLDRAQPAAEAVGNWGMAWITLLSRREVYLRQGQPERMFAVFDEMLAMSRRVGNYRLECWTLGWDSIYAQRYHSFERALFKRQAAMVLAEEFGLEYDRAWSALEIGDIYRVMGDSAAARRWYDTALPQFEQQGQEMGIAFYRRGVGDLALARGDWNDAREHHHAYLAWAAAGDTWSHIYALAALGRAEMGLGRPDAALGRFREALRLAVSSGRSDTLSYPVACLARLAAAQGRGDLAARLAAAVVESPLTWIETREWARELVGEQEPAGGDSLETLVKRLAAIDDQTAATWLDAAESAHS